MYSTYDIFDDVLGLRNMVEKFFNDNPMPRRRVDFPYVNLYEHTDEVEITALLPGVKADSLNIELVDTSLVIEGEKPSDIADRPYIRKEREFGKFKKSVRLPYRVDMNRIQAEMKDGVLSIRLAKAEEAKPKKIEVK
jgi:HSP20 family protein